MADLASLPMDMGVVLAQAVPGGGDPLTNILLGLGASGLPTAIVWMLHQQYVKRSTAREEHLQQQLIAARAENREKDDRLFRLAYSGMAVGQTATEVAQADATATDPELIATMRRLEDLLERRGGGG